MFREGKNKELLNELIELQKVNDEEGVKQKVYGSLSMVEAEYGELPKKTYTDEQIAAYENIGGAPHLDWEYTVFGKVVEGLEVVDMIANEPTGARDVPVDDVYMTVKVEKMSRKKITKLYGVQYPE